LNWNNLVSNPWAQTIGGGVVVLFVGWLAKRFLVKPDARGKGESVNSGQGGQGGNAKVVGSGIAIGGPGGHGGKYGRGGDGGGGEVQGDGIAAGGAGGSADGDDLWCPPAQSGYDALMAATGQPIEPKMRQYGRGGMSPGYAFRYNIVEQIRREYFETYQKQPENALENVNAVPLDYVNQQLAAMDVNWRARVVRGLDYEFYVPATTD
jgi:hypothetical protein